MNILCTGSNGFMGHHLMAKLQTKGYNPLGVRSEAYDLRQVDAVERLFKYVGKIDVLFHLAATVGGIGANQLHPGKFFYDNMMMGLNIIHAARQHNVDKVVMVGTTCSYPKFAPIPFGEHSLFDGYPELTNAPYGIAKRSLLVMLQAYQQEYGLRFAYLIPTNCYGPCFSEDTKVLTCNGIKNIKDIIIGEKIYTLNPDTNEVEISEVIDRQTSVTTELFDFQSQTVNFSVTSDHKIYYKTGASFQKRPAEFFRNKTQKKYGQIIFAHHKGIDNKRENSEIGLISLIEYIDNNHIVEGNCVRDFSASKSRKTPYIYDEKDWAEFLGWFISEGHISNEYPQHNTYGQVHIAQYKSANPNNYEQIKSLLDRMNIHYGYSDTDFYFSSRLFRNYLQDNVGMGAQNKRIPTYIFSSECTKEVRQILFDTLLKGDGTDNRKYTTKSFDLKNDFIHLAFLLGYRTTVNYDGCWRIGIRRIRVNSTVKYKNISVKKVNLQKVYCITVAKNHLIYAGKNDKFNWIGQCDNFDNSTSHVIPALIKKCLQAKANNEPSITVWGSGKASRDFVYIEDVAEALVLAMEKYDSPEPLNLGSGSEINISTLVYLIKQATGYSGNTVFDTSKPDGQPRRRLDTKAAKAALAWEATTDLPIGLNRTIQWYKEQIK